MFWICCNLWHEWRSFYVMMISCGCVTAITISARVMMTWGASVGASVMWSEAAVVCVLFWLWFWYLQECDCDLDLLHLCLSLWQCLKVDLVQCLVLEWCLLWHAGVPDGGILSGLSVAICAYSSHPKHLIFGQWHAMCPNSWHWKHWSPSLDIILTVDKEAVWWLIAALPEVSLPHWWHLLVSGVPFHKHVLQRCGHS